MKLALVVVSALVACRGGSAKPHRGSAAPVQMIDQPALPDAGARAGATTTDEAEPNDTDDVATVLALGGTVRAKIDAEGDVDRFRIDVDKPGALAVMVSGVEQDLSLEITDAAGNPLAKSDRGGVRVKEGVPNLGVTPGRYIAIVRAVPKKKPKPVRGKKPPAEAPAGPGPAYEITAQLAQPTGNVEREPDDDRGTANDLILDDPVTGYLGWAGDADSWKLAIEALSAKNAIDVEIAAVDGVALSLEITDALGTTLLERKVPTNQPLVVRGFVPVVPQGGTPFHYLVVRGERSNPETPYQLRVIARPIDVDAEIEPDDTPDHAYQIPADRKVVHASWTTGDVDCFALAVSANARTIDVLANPTQGDLALSLEVLVDGKVAASAAKGGRNAQEKVTAKIPPGARPVIRVRGLEASSPEGKYDVNVTESE